MEIIHEIELLHRHIGKLEDRIAILEKRYELERLDNAEERISRLEEFYTGYCAKCGQEPSKTTKEPILKSIRKDEYCVYLPSKADGVAGLNLTELNRCKPEKADCDNSVKMAKEYFENNYAKVFDMAKENDRLRGLVESVEKILNPVSDMENLFCLCCEDTQESIQEALAKITEFKEGR